MKLEETLVALMMGLKEQGYSFANALSDDSFDESWDYLSKPKQVGMKVLNLVMTEICEAEISYDSIDPEAFARDLAKLSSLRDDILVSWAFKSGSLCLNAILPVGENMTDDELLRFFKKFDQVVVDDMREHAGEGAMDNKLGVYGTVFFVFSDSGKALGFRDRTLKKCYESHFWKQVYCSAIMIDCQSGELVQGRAVFGAKWSGGMDVSVIDKYLKCNN